MIPIINENDTLSIAEIKFGDNDTLSAVTAGMCKADYLFLMTDVDCLYTENPRKNPLAQMVKVVYDIEGVRRMGVLSCAPTLVYGLLTQCWSVLSLVSTATLGSSLGTGGMETKLIAAELATVAGVSTIICNGSKPQSIAPIITHIQQTSLIATLPCDSPALLSPPEGPTSSAQSPVYTVFMPRSTPLTDRKFWVAHGLTSKGFVIIDRGAFKAIRLESNGGRLLPSGLVSVSGTFAVGQAVTIIVPSSYLDQCDDILSEPEKLSSSSEDAAHAPRQPTMPETVRSVADYVEVGRGLANYNSHDMDKVKGSHRHVVPTISDLLNCDVLTSGKNGLGEILCCLTVLRLRLSWVISTRSM